MSLPVFQPVVYGAHPGTIADFATTGGFTVTTPTGAGGATAVGVSDVLAGFAKSAGNTVTAAIESATAVGDAFTVTDFVQAGHNTVTAMGKVANAAGDAFTLSGFAQAGHDVVNVTAQAGALAEGDADTMSDHARGGYNTVNAAGTAVGMGTAEAFGDAETMSGLAQGGHNSVTVTSFFPALMPASQVGAYGDALTMTDLARGGGNTVTGSVLASPAGAMPLFGDAGTMSGFASGGCNTLQGVAGSSTVMYGDAQTLSDHASGGGNTLIGASLGGAPAGEVTNTMYGDGQQMLGFASGGNNTLTAGQGSNDTMWGGAATVSPTAHIAANAFVFHQGIGHDTIMDFRSGVDHIDLQGFGLNSFQQLEQLFQTTANGLDIVFNASSDILLHGVSQAASGDFVFS